MKLCRFLLILLAATQFALAEKTFVGLDGKTHEIPPEDKMSAAAFEKIILEAKEAMYQNTGGVGEIGSLSEKGGQSIIRWRLTDLLTRISAMEQLATERYDDRRRLDQRRALLESIETQLENTQDKDRRTELAKRYADEVDKFRQEDQKHKSDLQAAALVDFQHSKKIGSPRSQSDLEKTIQRWNEQLIERRRNIDRQLGLSEEKGRSELDRKMSALYAKRLKEENENILDQEEPTREILRLMKGLPAAIQGCHKELFDKIPEVLTGAYAPALSPALAKTLEARFKTDPEYAARFQKEMLIHPQAADRAEAKPGPLNIGSAQGLALFLAAGAAHPEQKVSLPNGVRIWGRSFHADTAPTFLRLSQEYGVDPNPQFVTDRGKRAPPIAQLDVTSQLGRAYANAREPDWNESTLGEQFKASTTTCHKATAPFAPAHAAH